MLERQLDLFWKPPAIQPHWNESQGDQHGGSHARSQRNISRTPPWRHVWLGGDSWWHLLVAEGFFPLMSFFPAFSSAGTQISVNSLRQERAQPHSHGALELRSEHLDSNCPSGGRAERRWGVLRLRAWLANDGQVCSRRIRRWGSQLEAMIARSSVGGGGGRREEGGGHCSRAWTLLCKAFVWSLVLF